MPLRHSPLHGLHPGTAYPASIPGRRTRPPGAGHGMGRPARALATEYGDQLAFAAEDTGLRVLGVSGTTTT